MKRWAYELEYGAEEHARDDDEDDFNEIHINTIEGFCWLRLQHCISQGKLPLYRGFPRAFTRFTIEKILDSFAIDVLVK